MSDTYFLAPALVQLRDEVNSLFPHRDKTSDGWIGDASHAARASDHNPCWTCTGSRHGIVRALDVDVDDGDSGRDLRRMILDVTIGDPRVWYVISNGTIYSRTHGWRALAYTGSNGHFHHVHTSLRHGVGEFDTARWFANSSTPSSPQRHEDPTQAPAVDLSNVVAQFRIALGLDKGTLTAIPGVRRIQRSLNQRYGMSLDLDGIVGPATVAGYAHHEATVGVVDRPRIPDSTTLPLLIGPTYRMVP